jgi:hypothetical protein
MLCFCAMLAKAERTCVCVGICVYGYTNYVCMCRYMCVWICIRSDMTAHTNHSAGKWGTKLSTESNQGRPTSTEHAGTYACMRMCVYVCLHAGMHV